MTLSSTLVKADMPIPVSYTHLDVYKRQVLRHYIDRAFSAKTDNRPEFQNMIKDSGKRLFDMIIVWKLDRFARNRYDLSLIHIWLICRHLLLQLDIE